MADCEQTSSQDSQEEVGDKTEPLLQSEMDTHFSRINVEEPVSRTDGESVPLDVLQIEEHHHRQGVRILVRPLTELSNARSVSPGSDNCRWLVLRAEVASSDQPEHKVLAVTQTSKDIKFSVRIPAETRDPSARPSLWCELYYDPASDRVIFLNKSDVPLALARVSQLPVVGRMPGGNDIIVPGFTKALTPGTWRIKVAGTAVLDFRVLEKRPVRLQTVRRPMSEDVSRSSPPPLAAAASRHGGSVRKRPRIDDDDDRSNKRRLVDAKDDDDGVIMFLRPAASPLIFPLPKACAPMEVSTSGSHALLEASRGETAIVPAVCELDEYKLTKREPIASTAHSVVYKATHSLVPENIVTVKVLKTRLAHANEKPQLDERNVIRQADMWLRECQGQQDLRHESIVRYYGGDARFLSLYMEHVDADDLSATGRWRNGLDDEFAGSRDDARRILRDIASALSYLHGRRLVHNDIKPANILYSPDRGAVLCDFGLSTPADSPPEGGGTPYYVPPEFIGQMLRGPASDVWALGITMLYLLRRIPYPDSRARRQHAKPLYWQIAGINDPSMPHSQYGNGQPAASQMRDWLTEIFDAREKLSAQDRLEGLVKDMLRPNPNQRITMARVLRDLLTEEAVAAG